MHDDDAAALLFYLLLYSFSQEYKKLHSEPNDNMNNNVEG